MKSARLALTLALLLAAAVGAPAQSDAQKSFKALQSLAGTWPGKNSENQPVTVIFRSTAKGTALMNEIVSKDENMISMVHLDGDRLLLTHYCAAGNQPRLKASPSPDGKTFTFEFLDATNLPDLKAGHMHRVIIRLLEPARHIEEWIYMENGKEMKETWNLVRQ